MKKLFSEIPTLKGERVTLRPLTLSDTDALRIFTHSEEIYRTLPTFLYEKKYEDTGYVISHLYDECLESSLILGTFLGEEFCGLAEIYGYVPALHKASVGNRLSEKYWGEGISSETLSLMVKYLFEETDIEVITAGSMTKNIGAAKVLEKNGFKRVMHGVNEDWGCSEPTVVDKWLKTGIGYRFNYSFRD